MPPHQFDNFLFRNAQRQQFKNGSSRIVLAGYTPMATGTNLGASVEAGEPEHGGSPGGHSVWWTWTAPSTGNVTIDTLGSNFDTLLAVYTGSAVNALTLKPAGYDWRFAPEQGKTFTDSGTAACH